jgi:hypothetical protein
LGWWLTKDADAAANAAAAAAAATTSIPSIVRKVVSNPVTQSYLKNRLIGHGVRGLMDEIERAALAARAAGANANFQGIPELPSPVSYRGR